jgi:hypothetical protein
VLLLTEGQTGKPGNLPRSKVFSESGEQGMEKTSTLNVFKGLNKYTRTHE